MLAGKKANSILLVAPHQNEHKIALPFLCSLKRRLQKQDISLDALKMAGTSRIGWLLQQKISASQEYSGYLQDEPEKLAKIVHFVLAMNDVYQRARLIDQRFSEQPNSIVVEIHSAVPAKNVEGSGTKKEKDLGNGFSAVHFFHLFNFFEYRPSPENLKLVTDIARQVGYNLEAGYLLLGKIKKKLMPHQERIICLEVPAQKVVPMLAEGSSTYSLYYDGNGNLREHISKFEQLYCTHSFEGKAFSRADVDRFASLLLGSGKLL